MGLPKEFLESNIWRRPKPWVRYPASELAHFQLANEDENEENQAEEQEDVFFYIISIPIGSVGVSGIFTYMQTIKINHSL